MGLIVTLSIDDTQHNSPRAMSSNAESRFLVWPFQPGVHVIKPFTAVI
jgi:hypothetical protein